MRVIQISDCHLQTDPNAELKGVRTQESLERILLDIETRYSDADRLVITGDLTHDELGSTYDLLAQRLAAWRTRLWIVPGNHDERELMADRFADRVQRVAGRVVFVEDIGDWSFIGLDSHWPGKVAGQLGDDQLSWLRDILSARAGRHGCIFLHHPPFSVGSSWLDQVGLVDAAQLLQLFADFPLVRLLCCGHIHQERVVMARGLTLLTCPATGIPFQPETNQLAVDPRLGIGYRISDFFSGGEFHSRVERLG
ncbi:MAG: phosphodiesterase [Planctomycetota bacterium]